jgi:hypothetical protein
MLDVKQYPSREELKGLLPAAIREVERRFARLKRTAVDD